MVGLIAQMKTEEMGRFHGERYCWFKINRPEKKLYGFDGGKLHKFVFIQFQQ